MAPKITEEFLALKNGLVAGATVDNDTGNITFSEEAVETYLEGTGIMEVMETFQKLLPTVVAGHSYAVGEVGYNAHKSGAKATRFNNDLAVGVDNLSSTFSPTKEQFNPAKKSKEIVHNVLTSNYTNRGPKNIGLVKVARNDFRTNFASISDE